MIYISAVTDEPKQRFLLPIEGYEDAILTLEFKPNQNAWFYNIEWGDFKLYLQQLSTGINVLRQFSRQIPFGLYVASVSFQDPITYDAFITDCRLMLLNSEDVGTFESGMYGG
jgi:hypothetical protein